MTTATAERHAPSTERMKVGTILRYSWGYGQTNVDWFQVIRRTDKSVWIREIEGNIEEKGFMCGDATPRPGEFKLDQQGLRVKALRKKVQEQGGEEFVKMDYGLAVPWNGRPAYVSWYY